MAVAFKNSGDFKRMSRAVRKVEKQKRTLRRRGRQWPIGGAGGAGDGGSSQYLELAQVVGYLGRGWYRCELLDMAPPELPSDDIINEGTGEELRKRLVQPYAGWTTWTYNAPGDWTASSSCSPIGDPGLPPDEQDYPEIEAGQTVTLPCQYDPGIGDQWGDYIPVCTSSTCTYEWDGSAWQYVPQEDAETAPDEPNVSPDCYSQGGCQCSEPTGTGNAIGERVITFCDPTACDESPTTRNWIWKQDAPGTDYGTFTPHWEATSDDCGHPSPEQDDIDGGWCTAVEPLTPGTTEGQTATTPCYPNSLSLYVSENNDPSDLCCLVDAEIDPDTVPRQNPIRETNEIENKGYGEVLAFQLDKMTISPGKDCGNLQNGNLVWLQKFKTGVHEPGVEKGEQYAIVEVQETLLSVAIPVAFECCPEDNSIKITGYENIVVRGLLCAPTDDPCPVPEP